MAEQIYPLLPILLLYNRATPSLYNKTNHQTISLYNWTSLSNHWSILSYHVHIAIHTHIHKYVHTHTMSISCFGGGRVAISLVLALFYINVPLSVKENTMYIFESLRFFIWIFSIPLLTYNTVGMYMSTHSCTTSKYICTHKHSYMNKDMTICTNTSMQCPCK